MHQSSTIDERQALSCDMPPSGFLVIEPLNHLGRRARVKLGWIGGVAMRDHSNERRIATGL